MPDRAVLIRYSVAGKPKRGSGIRIGGRWVLTADHCARGVDHTVVADGASLPASPVHVRTFVSEAEPSGPADLAVFDVPGLVELPRLRCGRVDRTRDGRVDGCEAVGFPRWKDAEGLRTAQAGGYIPPREGRPAMAAADELYPLTLKVTDPEARGYPTPTGRLEGSLWAGMSGAGVVVGEVLIGVVASHVLSEGQQSLTIAPLDLIGALDAQTIDKFLMALGVDDLRTLPVVRPQTGPVVHGQVVVGDIPGEPPDYIARGTLADLRAALEDGVAVLLALTGQRGIGKSQLAAAAARHAAAEGCPLVGWVNAAMADTLVTGLAAIADEVGVGDPEGDSQRSALRLRDYLQSTPEPALLILDNASDVDLVRRYLPGAGRTRIIVTSTRQECAGLGTPVPVDRLDRAESVRYLAARTGLDDPTGADRLAQALGDLVLALGQAGALIQSRHWRYDQYLKQLAAKPVEELLRRQAGDQYESNTAAALLLSIDDIDDQPDANRLGSVLSLLDEAGVPRDLLDPLTGTAGGLDDAIECAVNASVLAWSEDGSSLLMHSLTSRVWRERLVAAGRMNGVVDAAITVLQAGTFPADQAWQRRMRGAELITQIEALWRAIPTPPLASVAVTVISLRNWGVRHATASADLTRAIELGKHVAADAERALGARHPDTLTSRSNLASAYQAAGQLADAIDLYEKTLTARERVLGPDHPDTLASQGSLAGAYRAAGRLPVAIPLYEKTLTDRERLLGAEHPDTLASQNSLASAYRSAGRLAEAIDLCEKTLTDRERLLGAEHPDTLASQNSLASAYQAAGRLAEAIDLCEKTLTDRKRLLGLDQPHTLASQNNLASAYQAAGRLAEAIPLYEKTLTDRKRLLGAENPDTLSSQNNLAGAYRSAGRLAEAIDLYEKTLTDRKRLLGAENPSTLTLRGNLASAYRSAGRLAEAIDLYEKTLTDRERRLGAEHPSTLASRNSLAGAYASAGRLAEAIDLYEKTLTDTERVLGPGHPDTLTSRSNLAGAYRSAGRLAESIDLYEKTLTDTERVLGPDHPSTLTLRSNLAGAYRSAGRLAESIDLYERTLTDRERVLGPDHPSTLTSRNNLAGARQAAQPPPRPPGPAVG